MNHAQNPSPVSKLKLLPAYAGVQSLDEVLQFPRAARLLWVEILINEELDLTPCQHQPVVKEAFTKACRWYTAYRSVITAILGRTPLPHDPGPIDFREYRTFAEALQFVAAHP